MLDQAGTEEVGSRSPGNDQSNEEGRASVEETSLHRRDARHELTGHPTSRRYANGCLHQLTTKVRSRVAEQGLAIDATETAFLIAQIRVDEATRRVRHRAHLGTMLWGLALRLGEIASLA